VCVWGGGGAGTGAPSRVLEQWPQDRHLQGECKCSSYGVSSGRYHGRTTSKHPAVHLACVVHNETTCLQPLLHVLQAAHTARGAHTLLNLHVIFNQGEDKLAMQHLPT
jgi:hypothetical protein